MLNRSGLSGPADAVLAGGEQDLVDELSVFADGGATDVIVYPIGPDAARVLPAALPVRGRG